MTAIKAFKTALRLYRKALRLRIVLFFTREGESGILNGVVEEFAKMDRELDETSKKYEEYKTKVLNRDSIINYKG